jgi:hypothetical protein
MPAGPWRRSTAPLDLAVVAFVQLARAEQAVEERRRDLSAALERVPAGELDAYAARTEEWRAHLDRSRAAREARAEALTEARPTCDTYVGIDRNQPVLCQRRRPCPVHPEEASAHA